MPAKLLIEQTGDFHLWLESFKHLVCVSADGPSYKIDRFPAYCPNCGEALRA